MDNRLSKRVNNREKVRVEGVLPADRILFLDGSGDPRYPPPFQSSPSVYLALGGIIATHAQVADLNGRIESTLARFFPDGESLNVEIHASEILLNPAIREKHKWGPWQQLPGLRRQEFVDAMVRDIRDSSVSLFGRIVNKRNYLQTWRENPRHTGIIDPEPPLVNTFRFLLRNVDRYLARFSGTCQVIIDRDTFESELREMISIVTSSGHHHFGPWVAKRVSAPSRFEKLGPFNFEDSRVHRCLQVADFVANLIWRTAEKDQGRRFGQLKDRFPSWPWQGRLPPGEGLGFYKVPAEIVQRYR